MAEEVVGLQDLLKKLEDLPSLVSAKNAIARSLRKGAEPIRVEAGRMAPRSDEAPHLADTMVIQVSEQTADGAVAKIGPSKKGFYGTFQEFGTINHSAQPFLRPAFDARQSEALKIVGEVLAAEIEKAMKK